MGGNNRQRRAAKQRARARGRTSHPGGSARPGSAGTPGAPLAHRLVVDAIRVAIDDPKTVGELAHALAGPRSVVSHADVTGAVNVELVRLVALVVGEGWSPADLGQMVARRLTPPHLPLLRSVLTAHAAAHPPIAQQWQAELEALGDGDSVDVGRAAGLAIALGLAAMFCGLPRITPLVPPPGSPPARVPSSGADAKLLAKVRSLLAKAEATPFEEEAQAFSAKAQELMARYSLDQIWHEAQEKSEGDPVVARRIWVDAPYVMVKATLVNSVARANRCRSVISDPPGFTTVVGRPADLDSVELLATSLLVQANAAMLRCGRQSDDYGTSRTTSFRRSFLLSYATRIGERLRAASADALKETGHSAALVPVLRRHEERVDETVQELFPDTVSTKTTISNSLGWVAGRAAADLAVLDTTAEVTTR